MMGPGFATAGCGPFGLLIGLLLIGLLIYLLKNRKKSDGANLPDKAMEQLKMRLAQGDITPEEYQKMKDIVSK
ncbi:SHOCT domain-containing protein [Bacillus sp. ISL-39]|uniref:SHOCT domain-containing protein n=1 Tax=Bacillus sp. ISL-39 TaxID=2819124 RepID=UPI001BE87443|nr:SHOCT domain-containing protein [Bacillus sp. ISL-39]MBT2639418.1 SHOCT domain-containing protein [Bacillus sp. ISL-39]